MARRLPAQLRERSEFVGGFIRSHKGEGSMPDLMRRAHAAFSSRHSGGSMPEERNPGGISKGLVVVGLLAAGALFLHKVEASKPVPVNPYNYPLYPTGPQVPSSSTGTSTTGF